MCCVLEASEFGAAYYVGATSFTNFFTTGEGGRRRGVGSCALSSMGLQGWE